MERLSAQCCLPYVQSLQRLLPSTSGSAAAGSLTRQQVAQASSPAEGAWLRREYNIALRTEIARKAVRDDAKRVTEMACYMTHCKLSPLHTALTLQSAMALLGKLKCFATCAILGRRVLDLNVPEKVCCAAFGTAAQGLASRVHTYLILVLALRSRSACLRVPGRRIQPACFTAGLADAPRGGADGTTGAAISGPLRKDAHRRRAARIRCAEPIRPVLLDLHAHLQVR